MLLYKQSCEKRTRTIYQDLLRKHILPFIGHKRLVDIKQVDVLKIINYQTSVGLTKTRNYTLQTISQILKAAVLNDLLTKNVCDGIKLPTHKSKEKTVVPDAIIQKINGLAPVNDDVFMFQFLIYTGLRRGEMAALTVKDIDFTSKTITVNKAIHFEHNQPEIKGTKNGDSRIIPIFDIILDNLYCFSIKRSNFLFSGQGDIFTEQATRRKQDKVRKLLGYPITYHQCRHTFVTLMYNAGIDIKQAQRWSGHRDITVLLNTYTHLSEKNNLASIDKFNACVSLRVSKWVSKVKNMDARA